MLAGEMYDPLDPELVAARASARDLCVERMQWRVSLNRRTEEREVANPHTTPGASVHPRRRIRPPAIRASHPDDH